MSPSQTTGLVPLAASLRGRKGRFETVHLGIAVAVDGRGETVWQCGDAGSEYPLRSSAKPVQLLPFVLDGLDARFSVTAAELALMMSSHSGEPMHVERVASLLARFGVGEDALLCGSHAPYDEAARVRLAVEGRTAGVLHCNCSGKHAAMLAVCQANGWPKESYNANDHPLQRRIEALLRTLAGIDCDARLPWSIDGCSLPTWWLPLAALATCFARIALPDSAPALEGRAAAPLLDWLFDAATRHPEMIGGSGRLDTRLMHALGGRVLAKTGADGVYAMAVRPTRHHPHGLGIAIKIADGDPGSAVRALVATRLLAMLEPDALGAATAIEDAVRRNNRGDTVGERVVLFDAGGR